MVYMEKVYYVGSKAKTTVACLVRNHRHVAIVAPPGHGKTTLLRDVVPELDGCIVENSQDAVSWAAVVVHVDNFACRVLDPRWRDCHKVYVIDDLDMFVACERSCLADIKVLTRKYASKVSIVMACDLEVASKLDRVRPVIGRVDLFPVPPLCLQEYASSAFPAVDQGAIDRAVVGANGSFNDFCQIVSGKDASLVVKSEHHSRETSQSAILEILSGNPSILEVESFVATFGSHMFVDTLFHNAPLSNQMSLESFLERAIPFVTLVPATQTVNALDKSSRDSVNLIRAALWRGAWSDPVASVHDLRKPGPGLAFTNSLAQSNARSMGRRRANAKACEAGVTLAEMAHSSRPVDQQRTKQNQSAYRRIANVSRLICECERGRRFRATRSGEQVRQCRLCLPRSENLGMPSARPTRYTRPLRVSHRTAPRCH